MVSLVILSVCFYQ